jgi:hypothetical protein
MNVQDYLPQGRPTVESKPGHEANDLAVRRLALFAIALIIMIILVEAILRLAIRGSYPEQRSLRSLAPPRFADDSGPFIGPALQSKPSADLARMKEEELSRLNEYGWVDRSAGVAHIPIERAIDILARSGLPSPAAGTAGRLLPAAAQPPSSAKEKAGLDSKQEREP